MSWDELLGVRRVGSDAGSIVTLQANKESVRFCSYGELGTGKTMTVVREAKIYHWLHPNLPIFSNIGLNTVPYKRVDSAAVLFELNDPCFLFLDELWHLANSYKTMSLINDVMDNLLLRSRKKKWVVGYSQEYWTQTDLRIRYITERFMEPEITHGYILKVPIYNKYGAFLRRWRFDARWFYEDYNSDEDPFTLNLDELKFLWNKYRRDRGLA